MKSTQTTMSKLTETRGDSQDLKLMVDMVQCVESIVLLQDIL